MREPGINVFAHLSFVILCLFGFDCGPRRELHLPSLFMFFLLHSRFPPVHPTSHVPLPARAAQVGLIPSPRSPSTSPSPLKALPLPISPNFILQHPSHLRPHKCGLSTSHQHRKWNLCPNCRRDDYSPTNLHWLSPFSSF